MTMFSLREAAQLIAGATVFGDDTVTFDRVSIDSRSAGPGDLFIALIGDYFDAHDFLSEVTEVNAVLISRSPNNLRLPVLRVPDARIALGALAHGWRKRFTIPLVAVTGSNGKSTVKEMIASIFAAEVGIDARLATMGNFNNDIGLPLTLFCLNEAHRFAVVELGMNHPGETQLLAEIAAPTVAVVNNAQREHQEFMLTVEAVAFEHARVFNTLPQGGVAVFPANDIYADMWRVAATGSYIIDFALHIAGHIITPAAVNGMLVRNCLTIVSPQGHIKVSLQVLGAHNAHNALAATAAALAVGIPLDAIQRGLENFMSIKRRLQVKQAALALLAGAIVIDDTYNANPDSARAAIDVLAQQRSPRVLVMGDMGEVGENGPVFHREVGIYAKERGIEALYTLGNASRDIATAYGPNAFHANNNVALLIADLQQAAFGPTATILVKGSRFMRMERVVDAITKPQTYVLDATLPCIKD